MNTAKLFTIILVFAVQMFCITSHALAEGLTSFTPREIVGILYAPYLADPHADKVLDGDSMHLIYPYATENMRQAMDLNNACEKRDGLCGVESNPIINGQDWWLSGLVIEKAEIVHDKKHATVRARFMNGTHKNIVSYFFTKENGQWRIDDIEPIKFKENGKVNSHYRLSQALLESAKILKDLPAESKP